MKCRSKLTAITASLMLAASAQALEAKLSKADLPLLAPEPQHITASKRVTSRLTRSHYRTFNLNDEFSQAIFNRYLEMLDYNKNIFTQSDINSFADWSVQIDDELKSGSNKIAFKLYNLANEKRFERFSYALTLLDEEIKFDIEESMVVDRSDAEWPKNQSEVNELWRKRVKYDALSLKLTGNEWSEIKDILEKRYNNAMRRLSQTKSEDVFQLYMNAFAREVDPHTSYLSPRNAEQFQSEMNLSLEGIGAVLQMTEDYTVIRSLVAGGPASKSKRLSEGDRIIGVAQDKSAMVDVIGWRLDDVVQLIKGPKGTKVRLQILPEEKGAKSYTVTIVREKIRLEDRAVKSEIHEKNGKKIGVLEVPSFYVGLSKDTDKLITELKEEDVDGIVVDLRNNGGGALTEATALSGLFIKSGPIVQIRDSYGRIEQNSDTDGKVSYEGPVTILVNRYSASASEIFAAALQDYGRAVIVGENSFGKGTVQQHRSLNHIYDLFEKELGYVQYTIQKFYRINGDSTQNKGVIPDIQFPTAIEPEETGESVEDNALPWDQIKRAQYSELDDKSKLIKELTTLHKNRIAQDTEFSFINEDIAEYKANKDDNSISLNRSARSIKQDRFENKRMERIKQRQKIQGVPAFRTLKEVPKDYEDPDAYLEEAVAITVDIVDKSKS
ncbi:carboxy terminal-processing peptidase [Vibrio sp. S9_S30]|uniref:carboxy terminal-processing peptidase n=1 Tax=Vibrio sp. S9_S30 TaxID=2720226 RepID=UPI00167FE52F|nr:carboxy terminal-processing peptidase [Vibrio sp. S9_S30]MBD1556814.1 carboxy terminal-processing peptidase [Vibrio sp. S9_S30]